MRDVRVSLKKMLDGIPFFAAIKPAAFVLALIYPFLAFINSIHYFRLINDVQSVLYIVYLIGLLLCLAESIDWGLGAAFIFRALAQLISMVKSPSFNHIVYIVFYVFLAYICLKKYVTESSSDARTGNAQDGAGSDSPSGIYCPGCGNLIDRDSVYCPFCGRKRQ